MKTDESQISMIPVDIRLAKMLVLGALFQCLDPGECSVQHLSSRQTVHRHTLTVLKS